MKHSGSGGATCHHRSVDYMITFVVDASSPEEALEQIGARIEPDSVSEETVNDLMLGEMLDWLDEEAAAAFRSARSYVSLWNRGSDGECPWPVPQR